MHILQYHRSYRKLEKAGNYCIQDCTRRNLLLVAVSMVLIGIGLSGENNKADRGIVTVSAIMNDHCSWTDGTTGTGGSTVAMMLDTTGLYS